MIDKNNIGKENMKLKKANRSPLVSNYAIVHAQEYSSLSVIHASD